MQRPMIVRAPIVSVTALSLPPMYDWPTSVKRTIFGTCVILCIIAYVVMASGLIGLATLVLGLL